MRSYSPPILACWILESIFPVSFREALVGDLIDEYWLRARSTSPRAAWIWFWGETCRAIPSLIWSLLRCRGWFTRLVAALAVYITMVILMFSADIVIARYLSPGQKAQLILPPIIFLLTTAAGGCVLARIRRQATMFLALFVMSTNIVLFAVRICSIPPPWWYQLTALIFSPATVLIAPAILERAKSRSFAI